MKRARGFNWGLALVTPVVAGGMFVGLATAIGAAYENVRLARAKDQILSLVALARETKTDPKRDPRLATSQLLDQMATLYPSLVVATEGSNAAKFPIGMVNPWAGLTRLTVTPSALQLRVETDMPPAACRRMIHAYARDSSALGVQRVEVRDNRDQAAWRQLYQAPLTGTPSLRLSEAAIVAGCGQAQQAVLALTFRLK